MRRLMIGLACAAALALAGCGKTVDGTGPSAAGDQVAAVAVKEVQADVLKGCGYVIEYGSVAQMIGALGVPYIGMAVDLATQACTALTSTVRGAGRPAVIVNGKRIVIRARRA